ncbi:MAG: isoprenylcysteine carboxylmethyltransferase family protein [Mycobacterium sp.]|nr:isoprenylcysteine carboxylmethyltransferase family protein [Mycobacterium sp.]
MRYGVVCHLCFLLGVLTMMVGMFFGMSRSFGTVPQPWTAIATLALLVQFPVAHSLLLTPRGRELLARLAPPSAGVTLSTTTYVTIAALQVFAPFAFWTPTGTIWWQAGGVALVIMCLLYAGSWALLGKAMADAGLALQTGALRWTALMRGRTPVYPPMPVTGLFRYTRQPIYVAFALTVWTVPTWTRDQLIVATTLTAYCAVGPLYKEARFRRIHGPAFETYTRRVPYWFPRRPRR